LTDGKWPALIEEEYAYFDKTGLCLNAGKFDKAFAFDKTLISDFPPCFFAGNMKKADHCLLGINPGFNEGRDHVERAIYNELGWETTYLTFYEWFGKNRIASPYYSRFAVFLAGMVGSSFHLDRRSRFELLSKHLLNVDLIPYHSSGINLHVDTDEQRVLLKPYLLTLLELIRMAKPKAVFINGACFKSILMEQPLIDRIQFSSQCTLRVNERLNAHLGKLAGFNTVWFDRFLTGRSGVSNSELYEAGKRIQDLFKDF
jgi:hypothetical protein